MKCRRCKEVQATGVIFALCGPCMDKFEAEVNAKRGPDGKYDLTDAEVEYINEPFIRRAN